MHPFGSLRFPKKIPKTLTEAVLGSKSLSERGLRALFLDPSLLCTNNPAPTTSITTMMPRWLLDHDHNAAMAAEHVTYSAQRLGQLRHPHTGGGAPHGGLAGHRARDPERALCVWRRQAWEKRAIGQLQRGGLVRCDSDGVVGWTAF